MASKIEVINSMKTLHGGLSHIEQLSMAKQQALKSMNAICNEIKFEASKIKKANQSVDDDIHEIKGKLAGQLSMIPTILLSRNEKKYGRQCKKLSSFFVFLFNRIYTIEWVMGC